MHWSYNYIHNCTTAWLSWDTCVSLCAGTVAQTKHNLMLEQDHTTWTISQEELAWTIHRTKLWTIVIIMIWSNTLSAFFTSVHGTPDVYTCRLFIVIMNLLALMHKSETRGHHTYGSVGVRHSTYNYRGAVDSELLLMHGQTVSITECHPQGLCLDTSCNWCTSPSPFPCIPRSPAHAPYILYAISLHFLINTI